MCAGTTAGEAPQTIALYAALGFVAGIAHVASLRGNARMWVKGARWQALSLQAVRLAVAASLVVVVAHAGLWAVLLATTGFLAANAAVMLWRRTQAQAERSGGAPERLTEQP